MGMISQNNSLGSKTSMNENVMVVFDNTQRQRKQDLLNCMYDMYERIYAIHHALQKLSHTPKGQVNPSEFKSTGVQILLTGLPSNEILIQLVQLESLSREGFDHYMSLKHDIPMDFFVKKKELSILDLNGVKP